VIGAFFARCGVFVTHYLAAGLPSGSKADFMLELRRPVLTATSQMLEVPSFGVTCEPPTRTAQPGLPGLSTGAWPFVW
jgi:hypothetical protein